MLWRLALRFMDTRQVSNVLFFAKYRVTQVSGARQGGERNVSLVFGLHTGGGKGYYFEKILIILLLFLFRLTTIADVLNCFLVFCDVRQC
jgi:hypothetical protein